MKRLSFIPALFLGALLAASGHAAETDGHLRPIDPPREIPPIVFEDGEGRQHSLSDYRGRYVLLNIWATWCGPCVKEMPSLENLEKNLGSTRFAVVPVSEDRGDPSLVRAFYLRHNINHLPTLIDPAGRAPFILAMPGLPTTLLINPQGREIARVEGDVDWNSAEAIDFIRSRIGPNPIVDPIAGSIRL